MIRVNSAHATFVNTSMVLNEGLYKMVRPNLQNPGPEDFTRFAQTFHTLPIPRVAAENISYAVLFLASDESRYITYVTLPIAMRAAASSKWVSASRIPAGSPRPVVVVLAVRWPASHRDTDRLPGDVARHVRGEIHCGTGELVDIPGRPVGTALPMPGRNPSRLSRVNARSE
jgi:hypothetical protein